MRLFYKTLCFLIIFFPAVASASESIKLSHFSEIGLSGWTEKSFNGKTEYLIVEEAGRKVLQAKSHGAASGLILETDYDAQKFPILSWTWKIDNTIATGDSRTKAGDDYAARIYVVFPHWFFPMTKTINYIWANKLPKETSQLSVYTSQDMMIAVESGSGKAGTWVTEKRNIVEDYRKAFGEEPPSVGAIAIMTDTDDTGEMALAWYGEIQALRK